MEPLTESLECFTEHACRLLPEAAPGWSPGTGAVTGQGPGVSWTLTEQLTPRAVGRWPPPRLYAGRARRSHLPASHAASCQQPRTGPSFVLIT